METALVAVIVSGAIALGLAPSGDTPGGPTITSNSSDATDEIDVAASGSTNTDGNVAGKAAHLPATKYLRADAALCAVADLDT
ncbi:MAG: hypothetical protein FWF90_14900, partial [Promicromonosporaceae bacterium]|nr:hypothetical protein [Promicromonosporaceae bacterium]